MTDWASHKIAHELSAHYDIAHGATLSIIFPAWMEYVLDESTKWRFIDFGKNVWGLSGDNDTIARESIKKLVEFFKRLDLPVKLSDIDIDDSKFEIMASNIEKIYG